MAPCRRGRRAGRGFIGMAGGEGAPASAKFSTIFPRLRTGAAITTGRRHPGSECWSAWPWRAAGPAGPNRKPEMPGVPDGLENRADGHQRGRARPGYRPGHVPRGQHHLHREERVWAVQQPVRGHVPASGRAGHHHVAARRRAGPPDLHQARLPPRPELQHRVDGAAARQHAGQEQPVGRLSAAPGVSLPAIFGFTAFIAAAMALPSFFVAHRRPEPAGLPSAESRPRRAAGTTGPLQSNPQ